MLAQYHRRIFEHKKPQCVEALRQWVIQEAEFQTVQAETLRGIWSNCSTTRRNQTFSWPDQFTRGDRSCMHPNQWPRKSRRTCKVCGNNHPFGATSLKVSRLKRGGRKQPNNVAAIDAKERPNTEYRSHGPDFLVCRDAQQSYYIVKKGEADDCKKRQ